MDLEMDNRESRGLLNGEKVNDVNLYETKKIQKEAF